MTDRVEELIESLVEWAGQRDEIEAVALVGSYARETPGPDSDVDVVMISTELHSQLGSRSWLDEFGLVDSVGVERYGMVSSLRVMYHDGPEVEFGIAPPRWAWIDPVDRGTAEVVRGGFRILYDPTEILGQLLDAVS